MLPDNDFRHRDAIPQAIVDHRLRAGPQFLRGLEHDDQGARPRRGLIGQDRRRTQQTRGVQIVSARVGDRNRLAGLIGRGGGAGVVETGVLPHGECIHVGPRRDDRTVPVAQDPDDAGLPHLGEDIEARGSETIHYDRRSPDLAETELRIPVQVLVQVEQGLVDRDVLGCGHPTPPPMDGIIDQGAGLGPLLPHRHI